jgi:hypothetical protein
VRADTPTVHGYDASVDAPGARSKYLVQELMGFQGSLEPE